MLVVGSTGVGKSTFVNNLLMRMGDLISVEYDYIVVFIGTAIVENEMARLIKEQYPDRTEIVPLNEVYSNKSEFIKEFPKCFENYLIEGKNGCIIFDDLMVELANCEILVPLYTRLSSHRNISTINITQNMFYKGSGKRSGDHVTLYRNCHYLVLFKSTMDNSIFETVARRLSRGSYKDILRLFETITDEHRYIVIDGRLSTPKKLRFKTDIFSYNGTVPFQRVYAIDK
jgi:adenylate kinase family enzyme